jgi:hypothetical protein
MTKKSFLTKARAATIRAMPDDMLRELVARRQGVFPAMTWETEEAAFATKLLADRALAKAADPLGLHKAPEGAKLPNPPIQRRLTFNFTVQEWRALVVSAQKGTLALDDMNERIKINFLCQEIADACGQFDALGRFKRVE